MDNSKKYLMEKGKKMLNVILECHVIGPHALSHEVSAYIYIDVFSSSFKLKI